MTLDDFQTRLRAIFDETLKRSVETQAAHEAALDVLFKELEAVEADATPFGGIVAAEVARFNDAIGKLQKAGG